MAVITNDIYTKEDAEFLTRRGALPAERVVGVETGGCPHTAIREDASVNLEAIQDLLARFPGLELVIVESGGDNLAATFSPELVDATIYVIDVAEGEKIPRKGGPGITRSDLLVINKIDLAPHVGASLEVMERDARRMRGERPFVFTNLRTGEGVERIVEWIRSDLLLPGLTASGAEAPPLRVGRDGRLCLRFARRGERTVLAHGASTVPLQVLAPVRLPDPAAVVSILNPTGGLLGGDRLTIEVGVGPDAHACLTTPSATRIARTNGPVAEQDVRLAIDAGGCLEWLPDHTIPSAGSAFRQRIDVDLAPGARLILVDGFAAGRVARGEAWRFARLESAISVREGSRWIIHDRFALGPGGPWASLGCAEGHPYFGSAVVVGTGNLAALACAITAALDEGEVTGGAALGPRGGLVARVLAPTAPALIVALETVAALARRELLGLPPLPRRRL